jgi:hypothetical protein
MICQEAKQPLDVLLAKEKPHGGRVITNKSGVSYVCGVRRFRYATSASVVYQALVVFVVGSAKK